MYTKEMQRRINALVRDYGVAAVYSVLNSVYGFKKGTHEYQALVAEALNRHFGDRS